MVFDIFKTGEDSDSEHDALAFERHDGVTLRIAEVNLTSLFMTGGYTETFEGVFVCKQDVIIRRTCNRVHDFAGRRLLEGTIDAPAIMFSGLK